MSELNVKDLKRALIDAGLEVFRVRDDEVHLAERQNVQLMEAGIRVRGGARPAVITVVARAQRNDAPALNEATRCTAQSVNSWLGSSRPDSRRSVQRRARSGASATIRTSWTFGTR